MNRTILSPLSRSFVAVVETGSITSAADTLGMAKSAISQNLKHLELQLGVKLATRTTRRFSLTPAGQQYYRRCKEILTLAKTAENEMELYGAEPIGPITVTAPHAMIAPIIAPAIFALRSQYPQIKPRLIAEDKRLDLITNGIDIAITVGALKDSTLKSRKIGTMRDVLCVSEVLAKDLSEVSVKELLSMVQSFPYIAHEREPSASVDIDLYKPKSSSSLKLRFKPELTVNTVESLIALTRQGLGIALLPDFAILDDLRSGTLVELFPGYSLGEKAIHAVHAYDDQLPKSFKALNNAIKARMIAP